MKEFLIKKAEENGEELENDFINPIVKYGEDVCDDYVVERDACDDEKSYIYKIGCLAVIDGNKSDWVNFYLAYQREEDSEPEFIGKLSFPDGENTDIIPTIKRIKKVMKGCWWWEHITKDW